MYYAKLSLITLCCLFEDDTVNEMFHSDQLLCVIPYYQVPVEQPPPFSLSYILRARASRLC
jgi:hypothetical protein